MIYSVKHNGLPVAYFSKLFHSYMYVADVATVISISGYTIVDNKGNVFFTGVSI